MDLNTLDVDTLVVPYLESDKDNKSTKKLAKYLGLNIQEVTLLSLSSLRNFPSDS